MPLLSVVGVIHCCLGTLTGCGIAMSARPRPVTATFPPPVVVDYRPQSAHNGSLSDGSSTASLLSVLDHDSCEISDNEYLPR
jgi:hypothetical protein